jgi:sugar phosphate isomerase/epimerase
MPLVALSSGSLYTYGLRRVFELAGEIGFDGLEILVDQRPDTFQPHYLRRLTREQGLPILALHSPFLPGAGWGGGDLACVRRTVAVAQEVGAPVVVAHLPRRIRGVLVQFLWRQGHRALIPLPWGGDREWLAFIRDGLTQLETATGVIIAVENMPARRIGPFRVNGNWLNTRQEMGFIPHITLDTTHLGTWGHDPLTFYGQLRDRIAHVHLSNFNGKEHRLLDDGHLPLARLLKRLSADGYGGLITLETNPNALQAEDESRVRAHLRRNLDLCRQYLAPGLSSPGSETAAHRASGLDVE